MPAIRCGAVGLVVFQFWGTPDSSTATLVVCWMRQTVVLSHSKRVHGGLWHVPDQMYQSYILCCSPA